MVPSLIFSPGDNNARGTELKVLTPLTFTWMIDPDEGIFIFVAGGNATALAQVAEAAGEGEVTVPCVRQRGSASAQSFPRR
jgi:hypothetical protein